MTDPHTRRLLAQVLGEALDAAGGFCPDHNAVAELITILGITRDEARAAMGTEPGADDYLGCWPGEEPR